MQLRRVWKFNPAVFLGAFGRYVGEDGASLVLSDCYTCMLFHGFSWVSAACGSRKALSRASYQQRQGRSSSVSPGIDKSKSSGLPVVRPFCALPCPQEAAEVCMCQLCYPGLNTARFASQSPRTWLGGRRWSCSGSVLLFELIWQLTESVLHRIHGTLSSCPSLSITTFDFVILSLDHCEAWTPLPSSKGGTV